MRQGSLLSAYLRGLTDFFSGFLRKYPDERVHIINLLIGDVFKEGVDSVYGPMSEFAEIPPPLYEQLDGSMVAQVPTPEESELLLSAKYMYFDDRSQMETDSADQVPVS